MPGRPTVGRADRLVSLDHRGQSTKTIQQFTSGRQTSQSAAGDISACKSIKAVLANSATGLSKRSPKDPAAYGTQPYADSHR